MMNRINLCVAVLALAAFSASADFVWTGAAGDGKWFTAGNWEGGVAPGNSPKEPVLIDGSGFAADAKPVVEYIPGGDLKPGSSVTVRGGAKLVQTGGGSWMQFDANGGSLVLDGGTFDVGTAGQCLLADVSITAGGVLTNSLNKSIVVKGTFAMDGGFIGPIVNGNGLANADWRVTGGSILSLKDILTVPATATDFGETAFRVYGLRLNASGKRLFWRGGGVILGRENGDSWNNWWIHAENKSYIDLTPESTATFTYPLAQTEIFSKLFDSKSDKARFRINDTAPSQEMFDRYVQTWDYVYEDGVTHGTTFGFRRTAIFNGDAAMTSEDGATQVATVDVEQAGFGGSTLYLCWGAEDGGETLEGWDRTLSGETVSAAGSHSIVLPGRDLAAGTTYRWRVIAVGEAGAAATSAQSFTTGQAPVLGESTLGEVSEADAVFNVAYSGGIADLTVTVSDGNGNTHTKTIHATEDGTYPILVEGLSAETSYTWSVTASNGWGSVSWNAPSGQAFTTPVGYSTRTAVASGLWNDPAVWSPAGVPKAGNAVTIPAGVTVTNAIETSTVDSLVVEDGATLVFDGWGAHLRVGDLTVAGTLTHVVNSATAASADGSWTPNGRVNVSCAAFTLTASGRVDAKGLGYRGSVVNTDKPGFGPGASAVSGVGGSHGGRPGGAVSFKAAGGRPLPNVPDAYDSVTEPGEPGSGGFGRDKKRGGNGGGVVRIVATGDVTIDGSIDADGTTNLIDSGNHWTAGSGGAVYVVCRTLRGSGRISANGADARNLASGAGGGRIAVKYDPAAQAAAAVPSVRIQAMGGGTTMEYGTSYSAKKDEKATTGEWLTGGYRTLNHYQGHLMYGVMAGEPGTLWFPDSQLLTRSIAAGVVRLAGRWAAPEAPTSIAATGDLVFEDGGISLDAVTALSVGGDLKILGHEPSLRPNGISDQRTFPNGLFLTNCAVTVGGDFVVSNAMVRLDAAKEVAVGRSVDVQQGWVGVFSDGLTRPRVSVGGDAAFARYATLLVGAGPEDAAGVASVEELLASGGALVSVTGRLSVADHSSVIPICEGVSGGAPWFSVGSAAVDATSAFDATLTGYRAYLGRGLPKEEKFGKGPGGGVSTDVAGIGTKYAGAGGYGGNGGNATNVNGVAYGMPYDEAYAPFGPGSTGANGEYCTASGSGSVRIFSRGEFELNGVLSARGFRAAYNWSYSSSGGAVWVVCSRLTGGGETSVIDVRGGNGGNNGSPGGGGGRIAVWECPKPDEIDGKLLKKLTAGNLGGQAVEVASLSGWSGEATAAAGINDKDGNTVTVTNPGDGTVKFLSVPKRSLGFWIRIR